MRYSHDPVEDKLVRRFNIARHVELGAALLLFFSTPFLVFYSLMAIQLVVIVVTVAVCLVARRCWKRFDRQLRDHYMSRLTFTEIRWMGDGIVRRDVQ